MCLGSPLAKIDRIARPRGEREHRIAFDELTSFLDHELEATDVAE
ncbi:MAG: hypothetical protein ACRENG_29810 [bacterium]